MSKVKVLIAQADQSVSSGNYFLATKLLKEILQEEPENPWAYLVQARIFLKKKDTDEARRCLFTALRFDPGNAYAFYLLARSDYDGHDHPGANGWITKALENDPNNAEYLGFKSLIQLTGFENITEARSLSANGLKNEPDNITCLIASYYTESKAGNRDAANTYIRMAVQKYPDDPDLHALLAGILMQEGKRKAAYDSIMTSLRQAPGSESYQQRLKEVLSSGNAIVSAGRSFITSGWFEKGIKLLMPLAGISWMAGIYGLVAQDERILIPVFTVYNLLLLLLTFPRMLTALAEIHISIFRKAATANPVKRVFSAVPVVVLWVCSIVLSTSAFFISDKIKKEWCMAAAVISFIFVLLLTMLLSDYQQGKVKKYIIHGWLCIMISLGFFILVVLYPASGFELITGFLLLALIVFHGIRYRWSFNEKYDLTKTISANEQ